MINVDDLNCEVLACQFSGIGEVVQKANAMSDELIRLEIGDTDYMPPQRLIDAIVEQYKNGKTHYSSFKGEDSLISSICDMYYKQSNQQINKEEVLITSGGSMGLYITFKTIINRDEEVLVLEPAWSHFGEIIKLIGGNVVRVGLNPDTDFDIDCGLIERYITKKTKAIVVNYPNNPTGRIYSEEELYNLIKLAKKYDLYIVADEEYRVFEFDAKMFPIYKKYDKIITVRSFSKTYAMPGLRLGYVLANESLIHEMVKVSLYTNMYNSTLIQAAVAQVIKEEEDFVNDIRREYKRRRDVLYKELNKIRNLRVAKSEGGMYLWVDFRNIMKDDKKLAELLRLNEKVVIIPGSCFGEVGRGFVRISLSADVKILRTAARKIQMCVEKLLIDNNIESCV